MKSLWVVLIIFWRVIDKALFIYDSNVIVFSMINYLQTFSRSFSAGHFYIDEAIIPCHFVQYILDKVWEKGMTEVLTVMVPYHFNNAEWMSKPCTHWVH